MSLTPNKPRKIAKRRSSMLEKRLLTLVTDVEEKK